MSLVFLQNILYSLELQHIMYRCSICLLMCYILTGASQLLSLFSCALNKSVLCNDSRYIISLWNVHKWVQCWPFLTYLPYTVWYFEPRPTNPKIGRHYGRSLETLHIWSHCKEQICSIIPSKHKKIRWSTFIN